MDSALEQGFENDQRTLDLDSMRPNGFHPPLPEQAAIVRYLDYVDRRVRRLVRAKRKLIALLTEQKQAIIHRAVTRGLDPDVPLKDSGVEWLGEVPEHWEVARLRNVAMCDDGFTADGPRTRQMRATCSSELQT